MAAQCLTGVHACVAGWDRPTCALSLIPSSVPLDYAWCKAPVAIPDCLHGGALLGTLCPFAVPFDEYEGPVSFGGVATTQSASVVGAAYSRLLRAESYTKHRLLTIRAGLLPLCGLAYSCLRAWRHPPQGERPPSHGMHNHLERGALRCRVRPELPTK